MLRNLPGRPVLKLAATAGGVVLLAACSSSSGGHEGAGATSFPVVTSADRMSLPLDAFAQPQSIQVTLANAETMLIESCTHRYGFSYGIHYPVAVQPRYDRLYGITDLKSAQEYGYHGSDPSLPQGDKDAGTPKFTDLQMTILGGNTVTKLPMPQGLGPTGCMGEASDKLAGGSSVDAGNRLVEQLTFRASDQATRDSRVSAVDKAWSACMKKSGYSYPDALAAMNHGWPNSSVSPLEISTATADITCKQQVNYVGVHYGVETEYQKKLVDKNAAQLNSYRAALDEQAKHAASIVAAG